MKLAKHETQKNHYKGLHHAYRAGDIVLVTHHFGAIRFLSGRKKAERLASLMRSTRFDKRTQAMAKAIPSGYCAFQLETTSKFGTMRLWQAIQRNKVTVEKRIRKQDEAPQAGADSSLSEAI